MIKLLEIQNLPRMVKFYTFNIGHSWLQYVTAVSRQVRTFGKLWADKIVVKFWGLIVCLVHVPPYKLAMKKQIGNVNPWNTLLEFFPTTPSKCSYGWQFELLRRSVITGAVSCEGKPKAGHDVGRCSNISWSGSVCQVVGASNLMRGTPRWKEQRAVTDYRGRL